MPAFAALLTRPAALLAALGVNLVAVPALAAAAVRALELPTPVAVGVVLAAAAAGGSSGPLLAHHARGGLALAVSLQALLAVAGLIAVPLWLQTVPGGQLAAAGGSGLLVAAMLAGQAVPLAVGMVLRAKRPDAAARVHAVSRRIADVILVAVVGWYLITASGQLLQLPASALAALVGVVAGSVGAYGLVMYLVALGAAAVMRSRPRLVAA